MNANGIHLVRVVTDEGQQRLWAAATSREEAVDRVLEAVPAGSSARLLDGRLKPRQDVVGMMTRGEIRELSK